MVHNGIEYGLMQLIAESYALLKAAINPNAEEFHQIFSAWNDAELSSFLIEITADIFTKMDDDTGQPLVDLILDKAGQKGTGKWTSQSALDVGAAIPTITAAVDGRIISSYKDERVAAAEILSGPDGQYSGDRKRLIDSVRAALYASKICSYAQGMALIKTASEEFNYKLNLAEIARIWRAGCIIRAELLDDITNAYLRNPNLPNLLIDDEFKEKVQSRQEAWRFVIKTAVDLGIPVPAMSVSLAYFDFDLYEPTLKCLQAIRPRLVKGSVVGFDELNDPDSPGETLALMEAYGLNSVRLKRFPNASRVSYFVVE